MQLKYDSLESNNKINWRMVMSLFLPLLFFGCEDFLTVNTPKNQIVSSQVYEDDATAISAIRGIYSQMMNSEGFASGGTGSVTMLAGRSSDEFQNVGVTDVQFSENNLTPDNSTIRYSLWQECYRYIYDANLIIENLERSKTLTLGIKNQLSGEAKFIRAFCNFYLTNLFGDIPLILSTDYRVNANMPRVSQEVVYDQVVDDLKAVQLLLTDNYVTIERVRPNKWAATALLARTYLFMGDWKEAELQSTSVINNHALYSILNDLDEVFLKNSAESIWQLMPVTSGLNSKEGRGFILEGTPTASNLIVLRNELINGFEDGDKRKTFWTNHIDDAGNSWYYPFKYKIKIGSEPVNEYSMVLRLAEQYLIRAESMAKQNKLSEAITDIDVIRGRAGLPLIKDTNQTISQEEIFDAIERERNNEFFAEWGHRWLDLKRTGHADIILPAVKTGWQSTDVLYPIPQSDIANNPNLKPQNPGY